MKTEILSASYQGKDTSGHLSPVQAIRAKPETRVRGTNRVAQGLGECCTRPSACSTFDGRGVP